MKDSNKGRSFKKAILSNTSEGQFFGILEQSVTIKNREASEERKIYVDKN